jgi:peptide/nickel transport system ATP-binding protein
MTTPLLELRNVARSFAVRTSPFAAPRSLRAVAGVSLALAQGEVLGLVGESGCGKSTLARIMLGLLAPSEGSVFLDGRPLSRLPRREAARSILPVFQDPYASLNPRKTALEIVCAPLEVHRAGDRSACTRMAGEMLERVGLPPRLHSSYPAQLSGGQRQRVAIARALVLRPRIVVCDEPTSALDVSVQAQILNLLMELRRDFGLSYVLISHNLAVVEHMADRVAVMYLGRIVEEAPTAALFRAPQHPYTRALLASVLTPEPGLGVPIAPLLGDFPNPLDPPSACAFHPRCPHVLSRCRTDLPPFHTAGAARVACHLHASE